jgi:hypothetical protein
MMTIRTIQYSIAINQSLYYFLNRNTYISSGSGFQTTNKTLKEHYPDLEIRLGFPPALEEVTLPAIALVQDPSSVENDIFGSHYQERILPFHIEGFSGGNQVEWKNQLLRDQLRDELRYFLTDADYIDLYGVKEDGTIDTANKISDIEILNVRDENLPQTGQMAVNKYRFRISFDVSLLRDVSD